MIYILQAVFNSIFSRHCVPNPVVTQLNALQNRSFSESFLNTGALNLCKFNVAGDSISTNWDGIPRFFVDFLMTWQEGEN